MRGLPTSEATVAVAPILWVYTSTEPHHAVVLARAWHGRPHYHYGPPTRPHYLPTPYEPRRYYSRVLCARPSVGLDFSRADLHHYELHGCVIVYVQVRWLYIYSHPHDDVYP